MPVFKTVSPAGLQNSLNEANGKFVLNSTGADIPAMRLVKWMPDGSVAIATSTNVGSANSIPGLVYHTIAAGQYGLALRSGKLPGALAPLGLSAAPGASIFLGSDGSFTLAEPSTSEATVLVGFAEPADSAAGAAVDLLLKIDVLFIP